MSTEPAVHQDDDPVGLQYPNTARIWNYQLGGKDHFAIDRQASEAASAMVHGMGIPAGEEAAREGRHLLQRMVDYLLSQGIRQFLDLGSGLPNMANTHQVARRVDPDSRVVYVDRDPLVSSHAAALMAGHNVLTLRADLRQPEQVLDNAEVRNLIDFDQSVAIMFICLLHCLWDEEDPWGIVAKFRDAVVPGSYLAMSHMTNETYPDAAKKLFQMTQDLHWDAPLIARPRKDIERMFDGFTLVEPGLVTPAQWHPELQNPLRVEEGEDAGQPVLKPTSAPAEEDKGVAWHLCGIGVKN